MAAARQNEIKESATVVATTTLAACCRSIGEFIDKPEGSDAVSSGVGSFSIQWSVVPVGAGFSAGNDGLRASVFVCRTQKTRRLDSRRCLSNTGPTPPPIDAYPIPRQNHRRHLGLQI